MKKNDSLNQMSQFDNIQELRYLSKDELLTKANLAIEFEESTWKQRFKVQWSKQGDRNTKFFQQVTNAHKRFNTIDCLEIDGIIVSEEEGILSSYINLYSESDTWKPALLSVPERRRPGVARKTLKEEEILICIKPCAIDKTLGP